MMGRKSEKDIFFLMEEVIVSEKIELVINGGDLQENTFNERGIVTPKDKKSFLNIWQKFETINSVKMKIIMGNHESGYRLPLSTDNQGGISIQSLENFRECSGSLDLFYHSFIYEGYRFIFIPYIFSEELEQQTLEEEKTKFLRKMRVDLYGKEPVVIVMHDPDSFSVDRRLKDLIEFHFPGKIKKIFCGHYYAQISLSISKKLISIFTNPLLIPVRFCLEILLGWIFDKVIAWKLKKFYQERKFVPNLMKKFKIQIIPAPGGMLGFGGGFLVLDLDDLSVKKYP